MKKARSFLMEPTSYDPRKHDVAGWFICEYVHGTVAFWDGGLSRGQLVSTIPWAKSASHRSQGHATGLWSASAEPLKAEDGWLNQLPCMPLVGILFQTTSLNFAVTGCPALKEVLKDGTVNRASGTKVFLEAQNLRWLEVRKQYKVPDLVTIADNSSFEDELWFLDYHLVTHGYNVYLLKHKKLPTQDVSRSLKEELLRSPSGLLLRAPTSVWSSTSTNEYLRLLP